MPKFEFRFADSSEWFPSSLGTREEVARHAARLHGAVQVGGYVRDNGGLYGTRNYSVRDTPRGKRVVNVYVREAVLVGT